MQRVRVGPLSRAGLFYAQFRATRNLFAIYRVSAYNQGMPRHAEPYTVIDRPPSPYWYYKLAGWSGYRSTGIVIERNRSGKPTNRREAERFAIDQARAEAVQSRPVTLREYLAPFYGPDCPHVARVRADGKRYSDKFRDSQRRRIELHVLPDAIANAKVNDLTPGDWEDWKQRRVKAGTGARTINGTLAAVRTAIREGLHRRDPHLKYDPTAGVGSIRETPEMRGIFTVAETRALLSSADVWLSDRRVEAASGRRNYIPAGMSAEGYRLYALALYSTGERPSAWLQVRWGDINDDVVTFRQTKTAVNRAVPMVPELAQGLAAYREDGVRVADDDFIWCYGNGAPYERGFLRKRFPAAMRHAGLPPTDADGNVRTPYSLKHSLITHLIDAGVDEVLVREYVGHSHSYGTSRVLTPVQARYKRRQAERLREILPAISALLE